ncbi:hypothetical protein ACB092_09G188700 [Castanea dentata]
MVHCVSTKMGFRFDVYLCNAIFEWCVCFARKVFDEMSQRDLVSWMSMILGYFCEGSFSNAFDLFREMMVKSEPNSVTLMVMLPACCAGDSYFMFMQSRIHCLAIKAGFSNDVLLTSFLDFSARCAETEISAQLFKEIPQRNTVKFGAMPLGFIQLDILRMPLNLFHQMQAANFEARAEIMTSIPDVNLFYKSMDGTTHMETSVLNMCIRCGNISSARMCFDNILVKDIVTGTTMIEGFGSHGLGLEALELFAIMLEERIIPNCITFLSSTLTKLKEYMAHRLLKLEPDNSVYRTLLSNVKESVGQWGEVEEGE